MYAIDKKKDIYDYLSHIYGIDKAVTFDRRGSIVINDLTLVSTSGYNDLRNEKEGFILLEVGNVQYVIQLFDFVKTKGMFPSVISCSMKVIYTYRDYKHYYTSPLSVRGVDINNYRWKNWSWKGNNEREFIFTNNFKEDLRVLSTFIALPIMSNSQLASLIGADEIWKELQNYISSLNNDKNIELPMTDVEKAVNHGFDKKTSFRNPIK